VCKTDEGQPDILQSLLCATGEYEDYLIDFLPRVACHNADPYNLLTVFYQIFGIERLPVDVIPFELHKTNKLCLE
jgi:hypothetical protein